MKMLELLTVVSTSALTCIGLGTLFFSARTYKLDKKSAYSKLSIKPVQDKRSLGAIYEDREYEFRSALDEAKAQFGTQHGFPTISLLKKYKYEKSWFIELLNDGGFASTNIKLNYSVIVKRTDLEFGIDESDVINNQLVDFYTYNHEINIPYLGGNQVQKLPILIYDGEFPEADLIVSVRNFICMP